MPGFYVSTVSLLPGTPRYRVCRYRLPLHTVGAAKAAARRELYSLIARAERMYGVQKAMESELTLSSKVKLSLVRA